MMSTNLIFVAIFAVSTECNFLDNLPKCKRSDLKFDDCLKTAIEQTLPVLENGVSVFAIPSMQPISVTKVLVPSVKRLPFKEKYTNIRCYNHARSNVTYLQSKITDSTFWMQLYGYNTKIVFLSDYVYEDAIVLGHDMSSAGNVSFTHCGYSFELVMIGKVSKKLGSRHLTITNSSVSMTAERFEVFYENDDPQLSEIMSHVVTENWTLLFDDVKDQISGVYAEAYKNIANLIFDVIEFDVLFPL